MAPHLGYTVAGYNWPTATSFLTPPLAKEQPLPLHKNYGMIVSCTSVGCSNFSAHGRMKAAWTLLLFYSAIDHSI